MAGSVREILAVSGIAASHSLLRWKRDLVAGSEIGSNDDVVFGEINRASANFGLCLRNASLFLDGKPVIVHGAFVDAELAD